jgi:hypothetical protein
MSDEVPEQLTEEAARAVLARAIEIDARAPLTSVDQLRSIAEEIGVSPLALQAALREHRSLSNVPRHVADSTRGRRIAGLGVPLGLVGGALIASGPMVAVVGIMGAGLVLAGLLALRESTRASLRSFHLKNAMLWGGALVGSIASAMLFSQGADRAPLLVAAAWCVRTWIASGVLGSATILAVQQSGRREDADAEPPAMLTTGEPRPTGRLKRLLGILDRWLSATGGIHAPAA